MPDLYVAFLGGPVTPGRVGEDHEVVLVVAEDQKAASRAAKAKWRGHGRGHIDSIELVDNVDGFSVSVAATLSASPA